MLMNAATKDFVNSVPVKILMVISNVIALKVIKPSTMVNDAKVSIILSCKNSR